MATSIDAAAPLSERRRAKRAEGAWPLRFYRANQRSLISLTSLAVFLAAWELLGTSGAINPLFISSPSAIFRAGVKMFADGSIWNDLYVSSTEFVLGFLPAIFLGIVLGIALGWYRAFNYALDPFISALNATPRVALMPLIIIWFGIGIWSKVTIVFLGAIFPIVINTQSGMRALDETLLRAARSFGASDGQIFRTIALPSLVPFILSGMRVGLGRALVGIVVGELVAATAGIGYIMAVAGATFQTDKLFVGIFIITAFGVLLTNIIDRLEHRFDAWRPRRV